MFYTAVCTAAISLLSCWVSFGELFNFVVGAEGDYVCVPGLRSFFHNLRRLFRYFFRCLYCAFQ